MNVIHKDGYIYKSVKKSRLKLLIIDIFVLLITVFLLWTSRYSFLNVFLAPFELDINSFKENTDTLTIDSVIELGEDDSTEIDTFAYLDGTYIKDGIYRYSVVFDTVEDTGVKYETTVENSVTGESENVVNAKIYLGTIDDEKILITVPGHKEVTAGQKYKGIFTVTAKVILSDFSKAVSNAVINEYSFDTRSIEMGSETADIAFSIAMVLVLLFITAKLVIYYIKPYTHVTYRSLSKHGELISLIDEVECELKDKDTVYEKNSIVTKNWILQKSSFKLKILKNHMARGKYE